VTSIALLPVGAFVHTFPSFLRCNILEVCY